MSVHIMGLSIPRRQECLQQRLHLSVLLVSTICIAIGHAKYFTQQDFDCTDTSKCGYDACDLGKGKMINVHLIAHTHDDVGWLKTVDQYYYGSQNVIQRAGVQYILDTVVQALAADSRRRFTYVEMAFFSRWWRSQSLETRALVRRLVSSGQLQFALGGWSMADEATVHYSDAIDQLTLGRSLLISEFGQCGRPRVAWQIDAFGHARDVADLFKGAAYDAVFFQRIDYREKLVRRKQRKLEMLWDTGVHLNVTSKGLFTGLFYDSYCYPQSFCFDDACFDPPMQDNLNLDDYNIPQRVNTFIDYINQIRRSFPTNHIIVPMGCDFTYQNANINFKNTDKLIHYVNLRQENGSKINLLYSTPQCYTKAVNRAFLARGVISRRGGDFFPYATGPSSYWTGFFTSRPALKANVRRASALLAMCEQVHLFTNRIGVAWDAKLENMAASQITSLRHAMGVMQHHDAITGTEKQHVADNYMLMLFKGCADCEKLASSSLHRLMPWMDRLTEGQPARLCNQLNISVCDLTEKLKPTVYPGLGRGAGGVYLLVYNPSGREVWNHWVRVPIYLSSVRVAGTRLRVVIRDSRNWETDGLPYQLFPVTERTKAIPDRRGAKANTELVFNTGSLGLPMPGVGFTVFHLEVVKQPRQSPGRRTGRTKRQSPELTCSSLPLISHTTHLSMEVETTGASGGNPLKVVATHLLSGARLTLDIELLYYVGETEGSQASGAYVFLPHAYSKARSIGQPKVRVFNGSCVQEVHLEYSEWATLVVRLYRNQELEVEWTAGPLPDHWYHESRELIVRYTVAGEGIQPEVDGEFFTDSAGRRLIRRVRNSRLYWNLPGYEFKETQQVSGNYYPIVNRIMLKGRQPDDSTASDFSSPAMAFAVYTDRAEGGGSLKNGQLEVMLHRRLVQDDGYGVAEPLMESSISGDGLVVRGKHILRLDERTVIEREDLVMAHKVSRSPIPIFAPAYHKLIHGSSIPWVALTHPLPPQLQLVSLGAWPLNRIGDPSSCLTDQILVRLEHIGTNSMNVVNVPVGPTTLHVASLFTGIRVTRATAVTLTADQLRSVAEADRLHWPTEGASQWTQEDVPLVNTCGCYKENVHHRSYNESAVLTIQPGEIGSYVLDYAVL